jgi:alpha-tubulin suppressor-like RCC1 family protein
LKRKKKKMSLASHRSLAVLLAALASCAAPGCGSGGEDVPAEFDSGSSNGTLDTALESESDSTPSTDAESDSALVDSATLETSTDATDAMDDASPDVASDTDIVDGADSAIVIVDSAIDPDTGALADSTVVDSTVDDTSVDSTIAVDSGAVVDAEVDTSIDTPPAPPTPISLDLGFAHSCSVMSDLTLRCWGSNKTGQLALPASTAFLASPPTAATLSGVISVGTGEQHTCALMAGGTVKCWGYWFYGSLGDGRTATSGTPFDTNPVDVIGVSAARKLVVGHLHSCALFADGTAKCWGNNGNGQIGTQSLSPGKIAIPTAVRNIDNTGDMTGIRDITLGRSHTCVLADGKVVCWGYNFYGQLGDGTTTDRVKPMAVPGLTDIAQVAAGQNHTCALHNDGTVSCWGNQYYGAIGDGSPMGPPVGSTPGEKRPNPVKLSGVSNVAQLALGEDVSCARLSSGGVKCWGEGFLGQLGHGQIQRSNVPVTVSGVTAATDLVVGYDHVCVKDGGVRKCWGSDVSGQLGLGTVFDYNTPSRDPGLSNVTQISMSRASSAGHGCAVLSDKSLKCWGGGRMGQTGSATLQDSFVPFTVPGVTADQVVTGQAHTCVLSGTSVSCFGDAAFGAVGGSAPTAATPTPAPVSVAFGGKTPKQLAAGHRFNCALLTDGTVACWGKNDQGQLVDTTTVSSATPKSNAALVGITSIAAGGEHACAISGIDKSVSCWGENDRRQAGGATTTDVKTTPVKLTLPATTEPVKLALGENHTCILLNNKTVACFGANNAGQVGDGTTVDVPAPKVVAGLTGVVDLWAGDSFTCALLDTGNTRCWGINDNGQLADGSFANRSTPGAAIIGLTNISDLALGRGSNCAKLADGSARCWGGIFFGALGDNEGEYRWLPMTVSF